MTNKRNELKKAAKQKRKQREEEVPQRLVPTTTPCGKHPVPQPLAGAARCRAARDDGQCR